METLILLVGIALIALGIANLIKDRSTSERVSRRDTTADALGSDGKPLQEKPRRGRTGVLGLLGFGGQRRRRAQTKTTSADASLADVQITHHPEDEGGVTPAAIDWQTETVGVPPPTSDAGAQDGALLDGAPVSLFASNPAVPGPATTPSPYADGAFQPDAASPYATQAAPTDYAALHAAPYGDSAYAPRAVEAPYAAAEPAFAHEAEAPVVSVDTVEVAASAPGDAAVHGVTDSGRDDDGAEQRSVADAPTQGSQPEPQPQPEPEAKPRAPGWAARLGSLAQTQVGKAGAAVRGLIPRGKSAAAKAQAADAAGPQAAQPADPQTALASATITHPAGVSDPETWPIDTIETPPARAATLHPDVTPAIAADAKTAHDAHPLPVDAAAHAAAAASFEGHQPTMFAGVTGAETDAQLAALVPAAEEIQPQLTDQPASQPASHSAHQPAHPGAAAHEIDGAAPSTALTPYSAAGTPRASGPAASRYAPQREADEAPLTLVPEAVERPVTPAPTHGAMSADTARPSPFAGTPFAASFASTPPAANARWAPPTVAPAGETAPARQSVVAALDVLSDTIGDVARELGEEEQPGQERSPEAEAHWRSIEQRIGDVVHDINTVLTRIDVQLGPAGEASWSFNNRGYGVFHRVLIADESVAWMRLEVTADQRLLCIVRAHSDERAPLNAYESLLAQRLNRDLVARHLATALLPVTKYAARNASRIMAERDTARQLWEETEETLHEAFEGANGALHESGAVLRVSEPARWDKTVKRYRLVAQVMLDDDEIAAMHIERPPRHIECAVLPPDVTLMELGRRKRLEVRDLNMPALAELLVTCVWPSVEHAYMARAQAQMPADGQTPPHHTGDAGADSVQAEPHDVQPADSSSRSEPTAMATPGGMATL
ncbi:MAG: hypothetical protein AAFR04_04320 [Pseudomonadota bacterium]